MKKITIVSILTLMLIACSQEKSISGAANGENADKLIGTWKMVYGEIRENDSLEIKDLTKTDFIKIINKSHFAFFNQTHDSINNFYGGGGTYKLEGNQYTETLSFTAVGAVRGHSFPFTIEIKGDTLVQFGLEEVKEANIKRNIVEKYIRVVE